MSELPSSWVTAPLSELCNRIVDGSHNPPSATERGKPMLSARNIQQRRILFDNYRLIPEAAFEHEHQRTQATPHDILLSIVGTIGRVAIVQKDTPEFTLQRSVAVLKPNTSLTPRFLAYALESPRIQKQLTDNAKGTAQKGIYLKALGSLEMEVAPLSEQKRIADKLDAVLARVDTCRDRLDRIPTILKRFRQSVLAAATSGKLTEDCRNEQQTHKRAQDLIAEIQEAQRTANVRVRGGAIFPSLSDLPDEVDLPDAWVVTGFDAMAAPVVNALKAGPFGSALKKNMYVVKGYKIYGQEQVISGDENLGDYFIDGQKYEELSSCAVASGDILISLVGTIGRVLILSDRCAAGIINPRLVKLSLYPSLNREFVSLYLQSPLAQNFFKAKSHGGTMDILNLGILRELPILLPPITEQTEIVRRVETLFAYADRLEARYTAARAQVEKLTPATLAKAFRGELVPQDPNDEPASALLERIRAERSKQPAKTKRRKVSV